MSSALKIFSVALLLVLSVPTSATDLPFKQPPCEFSGAFTQNKFISALDAPLSSTGRFYHHCNYGVIWSTLEPIQQTLVMQKAGNGFLVDQSGHKKLTSRQSKFLNKLLNDLMGADPDLLTQQFKINEVSENHFELKPSTRRLKRGVKQIELQFNDESLTINIIDRNSQRTEIITKQDNVFELGTITEQNCEASIKEAPCSLLLDSALSPLESEFKGLEKEIEN